MTGLEYIEWYSDVGYLYHIGASALAFVITVATSKRCETDMDSLGFAALSAAFWFLLIIYVPLGLVKLIRKVTYTVQDTWPSRARIEKTLEKEDDL